MPSEKDSISEFNQNKKTDTLPYIIYADIESVIKKIDGSANNTEKSSRSKLARVFLGGIQCQQFGNLILQKTNILYIVGKKIRKLSIVVQESMLEKYLILNRRKCYTVNKRGAKIIFKVKQIVTFVE